MAVRGGVAVRLGDLAVVREGVEDERTAAWLWRGGVEQRAIGLSVERQPGTNTVAVAEAIRTLLPTIQAQLPAAATLRVRNDRSLPIRASVDDVKFTLGLTLVLVVLVIFLFLRNVRATIIPSLALPVSLLGTFALMRLLGYSLDNLSLMALTLAVGFVVDDAIVMLENIVRHRERIPDATEAALSGSKEVAFTIVSMTLSLAAVFLPVFFLGGIVGRLFREFAVTMGAAILVSGVVSLTLTPMLCARFLGPPGASHGTGGSTAPPSGASPARSPSTTPGCAGRSATAAPCWPSRWRWPWRWCRWPWPSPGASSPATTPAACASTPRRRRGPAGRRWCGPSEPPPR